MIYDTKNRAYKLIGCSQTHTLLECVETGASVKIANKYYSKIFSPVPV